MSKDIVHLCNLHFKKNIEIEPYVNEMFQLIEKTYSNLQTFVPIQKYQINYYQEKYLKYAHPEYIKCVSDQSNKLIGFVIIMPSFTKALKRANGKLLPFGIFKFRPSTTVFQEGCAHEFVALAH